MTHLLRRFGGLILIVVLLGWMPVPAAAQDGTVARVEVNQIDAAGWPQVTLYATAMDQNRVVLPSAGLSVQVFEDARPLDPTAATVTDANTGLAVVILLDLSGSMTDSGMTSATRFAEAQQAALQFVNDALQDGDLVGVVGFATGIYDGNWMTLQADRSAAADLLQRLTPETDPNRFNTALWEAAFTAMRMFDEHPDAAMRDRLKRMRRAVVAFTDGNDTVSGGSRPGDLREWANRLGVSFHTVGLKSPPGAQQRYGQAKHDDAKWLAEQTFGLFSDYGDAAQRSEFPAFLNRLAGQRQQLQISYPSRARNGTHETRVVISTGAASQEDAVAWSGGGQSLVAALAEPAPGAQFGCAVKAMQAPIRVAVQNPDGLPHIIDRVEFYANDKLIGTVTAPPYELAWDVKQAAAGQYLLEAWLHDATLDEVLKTSAVAVQVAAPALPVVQILQPAAGSAVVHMAGARVSIETTTSFPDGCERALTMRFRGNGVLLGESTAPPYTYLWNVEDLPAGQHTVSVEVVDRADGRLVTAGPVAFTVELSRGDRLRQWALQNWPILALALGLLVLLILLLRTRRQMGSAVGSAVRRVRDTLVGRPSGKALGILEGVRGPVQGRSFRLTERFNTIGRDPQQCEVAIQEDGYLSGKHIRIEFSDQGSAILTDLNSRHGTIVNGQAVSPAQPVILRGGERIRIGESEMEFKLPSRRQTQVVQPE